MPKSPRRRVLITAGARRLGEALARHLAGQCWDLALHYHNSQVEALWLKSELEGTGARVDVYQADLSLPGAGADLLQAVLADGPLHALIHNASPWTEDTWQTATAADQVRADAILSQSFLDLARTWQAALPQTGSPAPGPLPSLIAVLDARMDAVDAGHYSYQLAKRRLRDTVLLLAQGLAPQLRVNAVAPGLVLPPPGLSAEVWQGWAAAAPLGTPSSPAELAQAVDFLLAAPSITGQILYLDGGRHLKGGAFHG